MWRLFRTAVEHKAPRKTVASKNGAQIEGTYTLTNAERLRVQELHIIEANLKNTRIAACECLNHSNQNKISKQTYSNHVAQAS